MILLPSSTSGTHKDVENQENVIQLGRRYFSRLELLTNPAFLLEEERSGQIAQLLDLLKHRVLSRRVMPDIQGERETSIPFDGIQQISRLIIELIEDYFGWPIHRPVRLDLIGEVHDLFSYGGLSTSCGPGVRLPNNVPDSASIFFFPEFAILAHELGCDARIWRCLMPILTRMPALYLKVHELCDKTSVPKPFEDFGPPPYSSVHESDLKTYARQMREHYVALDARQLGLELARIAKTAFR